MTFWHFQDALLLSDFLVEQKSQALLAGTTTRTLTFDVNATKQVFCPAEMGKILCWPRSPAGIIVRQPCPPIENFFVNSK